MARRVVPVNGWTPTQKRIVDLLATGQPRTKDELVTALNIPDDEAAHANLYNHISDIRAKLRPKGLEIVCHNAGRKRGAQYQIYRMIAMPVNDEA